MKKVLSFIAIFTFSLSINSNVKAEESEYVTEVDNTNYSIESTVEDTLSLKMNLKGIDETTNVHYYVYFSNSTTEKPTISEGSSGCDIPTDNSDLTKFKDVFSDGKIYIRDDYYLLKGYQYAYVVKSTYQDDYKYHCEITKTPINVEKANLPELSKRYRYFNATDNKKKYDTVYKFPHDPGLVEMGNHKVITKIGLINDNDLLRKLSKSENGSLEELLSYAKTNDGTFYNYVDEDFYPIDISNINLVNGGYYYIYTNYDDELYRDLSDVVVYMAKDGELTDEFEWNIPEEPKTTVQENESKTEEKPTEIKAETKHEEKKEEVKNPKTGIEKPYVVAIAFVLVASLVLIILKNKKIFSK